MFLICCPAGWQAACSDFGCEVKSEFSDVVKAVWCFWFCDQFASGVDRQWC